MKKLTKQAEYLKTLHELTKKKAEAQDTIVGTQNSETNATSVSNKQETTHQNEVGADKNDPQNADQKPAETNQKVASIDVEKLGNDIMEMIRQKQAETNATSVSDKQETTSQNEVGADKNDPQNAVQKPAEKEAIEKTAQAVSAYNLGVEVMKGILSMSKQAAVKETAHDQIELYKEAGRRDFEALVAYAAEQLNQEQQEKQASVSEAASAEELEKVGAALFDEVYVASLKEKVASLETELNSRLEKEAAEKASQTQEVFVNQLTEKVAEAVIARLKSEPAK